MQSDDIVRDLEIRLEATQEELKSVKRDTALELGRMQATLGAQTALNDRLNVECSKERRLLDSLLGTSEPDGLHPDQEGLGCAECRKTRRTLVWVRDYNSNAFGVTQAKQDELHRILAENYKELCRSERDNSRLRREMGFMRSPWGRDMKIASLETVIEQLTKELEAEKRRTEAERLHGLALKQTLEDHRRKTDALQQEYTAINAQLKEKLAEEAESMVAMPPEHAITRQLQSVFVFGERKDDEVDENTLYDLFMQASEDQEQTLASIHELCTGKRLPEAELRRFHKKQRACRGSFATCLKSMGGVARKRGTARVWLGVQPRK